MSIVFDPPRYFNTPRVLLAPMAGYTDRIFRMLCFRQGCEGACSEMVSAKGLCFGSVKTQELLAAYPEEYPRGIQLFGSDPEYMARAVTLLGDPEEGRFDYIDINCGCPARKIVTNGDGSALMRDIPLAARVVEAVVKASPVPVSVKFRLGPDSDHICAVPFARAMEESGASFLCVHGRTTEQQYSGVADWQSIAAVKAAVQVPVIGNGDIVNGVSAVGKLALSRCNGVAVGRAALGNPFIFKEIRCALSSLPYDPPDVAERAELALMHAEAVVAEKGERSLIELRKHLPLYFNGLRGGAKLRTELSCIRSVEELKAVLLDIKARGIYNK